MTPHLNADRRDTTAVLFVAIASSAGILAVIGYTVGAVGIWALYVVGVMLLLAAARGMGSGDDRDTTRVHR